MFNAGFIGGMRSTAALKPLLMLFLLLVGGVTLSISLLSGQAHFQPDSASYVEQARSALEGKGFLSRGFSSDETGPGASSHGTKRPDFLFPPGYPIAIAVGSAISGDPADSVALWVTRISLLLLPITIFLVLEPLGGIWAAFCIALVVGASPGAMHNGLVASSDMLSLLLTIVSFGAVLTAIAGDGTSPRYTYAFVGGLVGGLSYVTRNANIALIASLSVSFAVALCFSPPSKRRELAGKAGLYAAGAALAIVPLIVRNIWVFGSLQPYHMMPSTVGLFTNIHYYVVAQIIEILGSHHWGHRLGWSAAGMGILIAVGALATLVAVRGWQKFSTAERVIFISSLLYAFVGAAVVIIARTKYQWGELISIRHAMPYTAPILLALAIGLSRNFVKRMTLLTVGAALMSVWCVMRLPDIYEEAFERHSSREADIEEAVRQESITNTGPCAHGSSSQVISNYAYLYRIYCDIDVVHFTSLPYLEIAVRSPTEIIKSSGSESGIAGPAMIALHPGRGVGDGSLPISAQDAASLQTAGWSTMINTPNTLVVSRGDRTHSVQ